MKQNEKNILLPSPVFAKQATEFCLPAGKAFVNGEITSDVEGLLDITRQSGKITDVAIAVNASGLDNAQTLSMEVDVYLDGVTCLTTKPKITYTSGEASQQMSTAVSGEYTDITCAVLDTDAVEFAENTLVSFQANLTRTASPTTEMEGLCVFVKYEPFL